jgi:hypothetical protein
LRGRLHNIPATYENVRMGHAVVGAAILTAVGITPEGRRRFWGCPHRVVLPVRQATNLLC